MAPRKLTGAPPLCRVGRAERALRIADRAGWLQVHCSVNRSTEQLLGYWLGEHMPAGFQCANDSLSVHSMWVDPSQISYFVVYTSQKEKQFGMIVLDSDLLVLATCSLPGPFRRLQSRIL